MTCCIILILVCKRTSCKALNNTPDLNGCNQEVPAEVSTQSAFTCSKLTIKTLEQGVKYVQR